MTPGSDATHAIKISVVIATFQRPQELSRCVLAIGELTYPRDRFEVIVVNDGGIVHEATQLKTLAGDVDFRIMTTVNAGPGAARNAGAAVARGRFLTFIDDDCVPSPDWLQRLSAAVDRSHDAMVGGRTVNILTRNLFSQASQTLVEYVYAYYNERGAKRNEFFASNNMTLAAGAFHAIGGFDESFRTAEDRELCRRWGAGGGRFEYVPDIVIGHAHRLGPKSFLRQHFGYGRGALPYWRKNGANGVRGIRVEPFSFYLGMLTFPFRQRKRYAPILSGLILVSQIANACGFAYEGLRRVFARDGVPLIANALATETPRRTP